MPVNEPSVVMEDADWLVVEKPALMLTHPTRPDGPPTLLDWLRARFPGRAVACVNRLDRETSGLVLAATHAASASELGKLAMARAIRKTYLALVTGEAPEELEIDAPLDRIGKHRACDIYVKQGVWEGGYPARTHARLLERRRIDGQWVSMLECRTEGGRLHQIRVHLNHVGLPLLGDKLYGPDDRWYLRMIAEGWTPEMARALRLPRQALHATRLEFEWHERKVIAASPLPEDLWEFWTAK